MLTCATTRCPFFDEVSSSLYVPSKSEVAQRWQKKVAEFDGFIVSAEEYSRGPTASLKNALDYAYNEWNKKAVGFVGYGGVGGARAVEQLRLHAVELQMAPIRAGVHIVWGDMVAAREGKKLGELAHLNKSAADMLDQLVWWTVALNKARKAEAEEAEILAA